MTARKPIVDLVALVTGSSRGIGRGIALRLAADGYDVVINDVAANQAGIDSVVAEIKTLGRKSFGIVCDVTDDVAVNKMMQEIGAKFGHLDTVVANAGIAQAKLLLETTAADRSRMMDVNVCGLMNTYIAAAKQMIRQGPNGGKIIGAASIVAYNTFPVLGPYSASKWAVKGFTQVAAKEWAAHGILVNAYAPGIVDTPMWDLIDSALGPPMGLKPGEARAKYVDDLSLIKRVSVPEDVAKLVSFLASDDAGFVTGQTMIVDGGICFA